MVEYEVTIKISNDILDDYLEWLKEHVKEMLQLEGFNDAKFYLVDVQDKKIVCVRYFVESKEVLENYIKNVAPLMRNKFKPEFENKFEISRRVLVEGDI
jgi:hypothetical protein